MSHSPRTGPLIHVDASGSFLPHFAITCQGLDTPDLLQELLRRAQRLCNARAVACWLEPPGRAEARVERVVAGLDAAAGPFPTDRLRAWGERLAAAMADEGFASAGLLEIPVDRPGLALGSAVRFAAWVPIREERALLGGLQVELADRPADLGGLLAVLAELAAGLCVMFHRALLGESLAAGGADLELVGASPSLLAFERRLRSAARCAHAPALITGERGSGKELAAWGLHAWSRRRAQPFVPVLLPAMPDTLVADELFGHERHAFTGAEVKRPGRFEAAAGGTLFLDEIGEVSPTIQAALLRVIERHELTRIGRDLPIKVDARVVAATNRDLEHAVEGGAFRHDLYDRLAVLELRVPPLRERREDIPLLARYFLGRYAAELHPPAVRPRRMRLLETADPATSAFYEALQGYPWPGNVRELKHLLFRLAATSPDGPFDVHHLPEKLLREAEKPGRASVEVDWNLKRTIKTHIERTLQSAGYNRMQTAKLLGIPYTTLQSKLKKLGIRIPG